MKRRIRKRAAVITVSTLVGWNAALKTGGSEKAADRYASDTGL
ncbi:hypothetical protein ACGFY3_31410 [Streptomyces mirabilis]